MSIIFDCSAPTVNSPSFAAGLYPPQVDNTLPRHPADAASIDEVTRDSIIGTMIEESRSRGGQEDNLTERHEADAASIDEVAADSIAATVAREESDRRERALEVAAASALYWDRYAEVEREAEEAELASRYDAVACA